MQMIFESIFDIAYLIGVIFLGVRMIQTSEKQSTRRMYGAMAVLLGAGDAFHLVPRVIALFTDGFDRLVVPLGFGKLVTSITMTLFYVMLYHIWKKYYHQERKTLTKVIWGLAIVRIGLCLLPQNQWLTATPPLFYGVLRNIPFAIMGLLMIFLFWEQTKKTKDPTFRFIPLAIALSFGFYIPVVLWSATYPPVGILMLPKTMAYVWMVVMGYRLPSEG